MKIAHQQMQWTETKIKGFSSKELLEKTNGTFKMVKISPDSSYPEHLHPEKTEYAFVLSGNIDFRINGESFPAAEGDFFIFPRNQKHAIINRSDAETVLLIGAVTE